ncbi:hypothetical protein [Jeotgalibaca ciconiae]|uniref:DUF3784 domain-containing protein n=1 Tax=Jeotgalibaca ciconiae TaxID=2496265 RepID=A0A3Q9BNB3_9LACT|nr:hypothetical protein [Jeotgalibaca ciconiae]AZP05136.1 hypothetical protein EJN90_11080 [Jeotgalibaca ciconiae]
MIQLLIGLFALLLFLVSWFLIKKANHAFILFPEKLSTEQRKKMNVFFQTNGIIYFVTGIVFIISIFINQKNLYAVLLLLISLHSAFFSFQLSKFLKGK